MFLLVERARVCYNAFATFVLVLLGHPPIQNVIITSNNFYCICNWIETEEHKMHFLKEHRHAVGLPVLCLSMQFMFYKLYSDIAK